MPLPLVANLVASGKVTRVIMGSVQRARITFVEIRVAFIIDLKHQLRFELELVTGCTLEQGSKNIAVRIHF